MQKNETRDREGEKIFANCTSDKSLIFKPYIKVKQFDSKIPTSSNLKMSNRPNWTFLKRRHFMYLRSVFSLWKFIMLILT
jgi:hypothetical protein